MNFHERRPFLACLLKFMCSALQFFLQIDNGRMAAAPRYRRAARLRLSGFATPCFHCFTAYSATPSHLALQFGRRTIPYHSIDPRWCITAKAGARLPGWVNICRNQMSASRPFSPR
jgi:hypothetical protein